MNSPADSLYDDVDLIDTALEPFTDPQVNERSGLRWMQRTLLGRREHIMDSIAAAERSTLTVQVRSAAGTASVALTTVTALLDGLQQALLAAGDAVAWPEALGDDQRRHALTLEPGDADTTDEHWQITLHRPAGPLRAQPVTDSGDRLAVDAALEVLLETLKVDAGEIGRIVVANGLTVELATAPVSGAGRDLTIDRHTTHADG